ncbi:hypothetical protein CCH79_00017108 [Gambusia affinis]|uniref:VPS13-like middle region domain-containing protein n=1 Tax=Gambusia affinis TaxID=33528 RepID=A0A315W3R9_GAMAF|nr:hypothetical protein CCH79_00017108 [Gambusia affinis]
MKLELDRTLDTLGLQEHVTICVAPGRELSHAVPDTSIHGSLSSVHCSLDRKHYQLIRGILENNLGEPVEEFLRPYNLQHPSSYVRKPAATHLCFPLDKQSTVLSGVVFTNLSFLMDMTDVSLELLDSPISADNRNSLARFDFVKSKVLFESLSDGSKSVNLVSHSLLANDTRFTETTKSSENSRCNVFDCILQASKTGTNRATLQLELHYRSTRDSSSFTVVLNNLRVFLIFDWLQLVHHFLQLQPENATESQQRCYSSAAAGSTAASVMPKTVKSGVVTKRSTVMVSQDRCLEVKINVTAIHNSDVNSSFKTFLCCPGTEFVVVEDVSCLDTNAIILKGTTVLTYKPRLLDRPFSGSLAGIEVLPLLCCYGLLRNDVSAAAFPLQVFSCRLGSEQETALSIIDPVNVQLELCGSPTYPSSSGLLDAFNVEDIPPLLEVGPPPPLPVWSDFIQFPALDIRLSYNDIQLFLSIAKSISAAQAPPSHADSANGAPPHQDGVQEKTESLTETKLSHLQNLGFRREDCKKALISCKEKRCAAAGRRLEEEKDPFGQLDQAATWLWENSENSGIRPRGRADSGSGSHAWPLSGVEVKAESVCICFIDDCLDCDIPLAELTFSINACEASFSWTVSGGNTENAPCWVFIAGLNVLQRIGSTQEGNASFTLSGDYYNRELSELQGAPGQMLMETSCDPAVEQRRNFLNAVTRRAGSLQKESRQHRVSPSWEPFIEPWPCVLSWQHQAAGRLHPPRLKVAVRAKQRLDVNITSVLLDQYKTTKTSWMADYCKAEEQAPPSPPPDWLGSSVDPPGFGQTAPLAHLRTRSTASLTSLQHQTHSRDGKISKRRQPFVPYALRNHTGCTMWFATSTTTPTRHTHELKLHQLLVRVCGWEQVEPVSVEKVGVFFRYAAPDRNNSSSTVRAKPKYQNVGSPISRTNIIHPHVYVRSLTKNILKKFHFPDSAMFSTVRRFYSVIVSPQFSELPPVRVVFAITMEGSARKVITVRSALMVKNRLDVQMEIRLDSPSAPDSETPS